MPALTTTTSSGNNVPVLSITSPSSPDTNPLSAISTGSASTITTTPTALNTSSYNAQPIRASSSDLDSAIRVVITPSQSSYFAGEPFSVTITFTNTRTPEKVPSVRGGPGHGHKRGAHSISSAPLARPPTSPGTPPARGGTSTSGGYGYASPGSSGRSRVGDDGAFRKGLIGKSRKGNGTIPSSPSPHNSASANADASTTATDESSSNSTAYPSTSSPSLTATPNTNGNGSANPTTSPNTSSSSSMGTPTDLKTDGLPELIEQRRKRLLAKSLSVSITPHELDEQLGAIGEGTLTRSATLPGTMSPRAYTDPRRSPTSPMIPSPLSRSDTLALSSSHPHARKQSLLDGQMPANNFGSPITSSPSTLPYSMPSSGAYPYSPSASSSTFSLALDPIAESAHSPYPSTPMIASPSIETPTHPFNPAEHMGGLSHQQLHFQQQQGNRQGGNSVYAYPPPRPQPAGGLRPLQLANGFSAVSSSSAPTSPFNSKPPSHLMIAKANSSGQPQPPRSAFSSTFPQPNAELILYSYVQLTGTLSLSSIPGSMPTPEHVQTMNAVRGALLKKTVLGGGSMDITASLNAGSSSMGGAAVGGHATGPGGVKRPPHRRTHTRSSSFSTGLLALLGAGNTPTGSIGSTGTLNTSVSWSSGQPQRPRAASGSATSPPVGKHGMGGGSRIVNAGDAVGLGLGGVGPGLTGVDEEIDPDVPLPTFEVQPSMLAVDLALLPGESRSYTYTVPLPDNLPPTFRGRSLKFSYELVLGTCRAAPSSAGGGGGSVANNSISRVMKVPIRLHNHVAVGRTVRQYDLLWPVATRLKPLLDSGGKVTDAPDPLLTKRIGKVPHLTHGRGLTNGVYYGTLEELQDYANRLLEAFPDPSASGVRIKLPAEAVSPISPSRSFSHPLNGTGPVNGPLSSPTHKGKSSVVGNGIGLGASLANGNASPQLLDPNSPWAKYEREKLEEEGRKREREMEREEEGGLTGCREAVEILTRNPKKASYDVNKDGVKVAVLTFTKSAYRLGETVLGVLELNDRLSRARVVQYSVMLEAHESLPSSLAPAASSKHLRRVHAEHHSSFTLSTLRTTFSLDIPSDASPAFQVRVGGNYAGAPVTLPGGLEWKVRLCLLVAVASDKSSKGTEGVRVKGITRDGGRGEWGSSWCGIEGIAPQEKLDEDILRRQRELQQLELQRQQQQTQQQQHGKTQSWAAFFAASFLGGSTEREYHDGDEDIYEDGGDLENPGNPFDKSRLGQQGRPEELGEDDAYDGIKPDLGGGVGVGVNFDGGEEGWKDVKLETVECEVPIKVWPGNTAFKAVDVVFEV